MSELWDVEWQSAILGRGGPLNFENELDRDRQKKTRDQSSTADEAPPPRKRRGQPSEVGDALRTVYQHTIDEAIPPEMLDLLGKLD
jgi:hypothetical protein